MSLLLAWGLDKFPTCALKLFYSKLELEIKLTQAMYTHKIQYKELKVESSY